MCKAADVTWHLSLDLSCCIPGAKKSISREYYAHFMKYGVHRLANIKLYKKICEIKDLFTKGTYFENNCTVINNVNCTLIVGH